MNKTNFEKVKDLNTVFNVPFTSKTDVNWDILYDQFTLIEEEFKELRDKGLGKKNWREVKDAIGDLLVVTYGMAYRCNIDADKLMNNISDSNFSKLCKTHDEVTETTAYYNSINVDTYVEQTEHNGTRVWAVKSARDQHYTENGEKKYAKAGKFLKNKQWYEPNLDVEL